jgi:hypothetical protein
MTSSEIACALIVRESDGSAEILLEQRAATNSVMPGMWELPSLAIADKTAFEERLTVRHAIMQVNYTVRVYGLLADKVAETTGDVAHQRWVLLSEASAMALTGLARKILTRSGLLQIIARTRPTAFASPSIRELV